MNVGEVEEVRFKNKPSDIFWLEVLSKETVYLFFLCWFYLLSNFFIFIFEKYIGFIF